MIFDNSVVVLHYITSRKKIYRFVDAKISFTVSYGQNGKILNRQKLFFFLHRKLFGTDFLSSMA